MGLRLLKNRFVEEGDDGEDHLLRVFGAVATGASALFGDAQMFLHFFTERECVGNGLTVITYADHDGGTSWNSRARFQPRGPWRN